MEFLTPGFQELMALLFLFLIVLPAVFFALTLQNTLQVIEPECRFMKPGNVWLIFIPLFNYIWMFVVVKAVANSLKLQFEKYGVITRERPTYNTGLAFCITSVCSLIPLLGFVVGIPTMVLFVLYWVKVNDKRKELIHMKNTIGTAGGDSIFLTP